MPIEYHIDPEHDLLVSVASGDLQDEDLMDYSRRLLADEKTRRPRDELVDLRGIDSTDGITTDGVRRLAELWRSQYERLEGCRLALLAESDIGYGLARMYEMLRDDGPDQIRVFREQDEAEAWLLAPAGNDSETGAPNLRAQ